ncbi:MAG: hypothetical protein JOZ58_28030 [Acetobacteraceae bacterium]|nr:hypothetical protein [Acetobacteraceae bacterium]
MLIRDSTARARSPELARLVQQPDAPTPRRYEVGRAYVLEGATAEPLARRCRLPGGTARALLRDFARRPDLDTFFVADRPGRKTAPKRAAIEGRAGELRRQGATRADIRATLRREGLDVRASSLSRILRRAGPAETRNRRPAPPPGEAARDGSTVPHVADVGALSLDVGRRCATQVAGLFLFLPMLPERDRPRAVADAGLPGSEQVPPRQALRALLTPKLLGQRRVRHIGDLCCDEGAGRFAGLNVLPKAPFATDSSYKTERARTQRRVAAVTGRTPLGDPPLSFHLDCHAIPFRGAAPDLEDHGVAMRNRALAAVRAFVAQAAGRRVIGYATANFLRDEADAMVPQFAAYWKEPTGHSPARLLFDARATTYAGRNERNRRGIGFSTIRRRGAGMLGRVGRLPAGSWRPCQVTPAKGKRRRVRSVDERVRRDGDDGDLRPRIVTGLGHESPTFLVTHDLPKPQTAREAIQTDARRHHVEHHLGEPITFFPLDGLGSEVRLNVDVARTLTVLADLLDRALAERLKGFARAGPARRFRKFVATPGVIEVTAEGVVVRLSKRAQNPLWKEAGLTRPTRPVPWLGHRSVRLACP